MVAPALHAPAVHPDTAMSARLTSRVDAAAVTLDLLPQSAAPFETATPHGTIGREQTEVVSDASSAVLDL
ncbi:hypothetical protein ABZ137_13565 [Streptomyces bobili]|uniref:hypothetical protein n=1 Tax=Streptomyces bobili TaxID=67280 RepID=UPI0033B0D41F